MDNWFREGAAGIFRLEDEPFLDRGDFVISKVGIVEGEESIPSSVLKQQPTVNQGWGMLYELENEYIEDSRELEI